MAEAVRIGIIGTGGIARAHAENVRNNPDSVLVGGVDVSPDARASFSEEYDVPAYESYEELRDNGLDAIIITTPNRFHAEYATKALADDIHVLCEKPLADTLTNAEEIVEAEANSDAVAMVGFNNRFIYPTESVKNAIESGHMGDVVHVSANWIRRRGIPGRGGWFTRQDLSGGGSMIDIGVHVLDVALYLLGNPVVEEVSAITRQHFGTRDDYTSLDFYGDDNGPAGFDVDDSVTAFIRCEDDKTIVLEAAWAANREDDSTITVVGTEAGARFDIKETDVEYFEVDRSPDAETPLPTPTHVGDHRNGHVEELDYFLSVITSEVELTQNTVQEACDVQRVIDAIYKSSEANQADELNAQSPPELSH